MTFLKIDRKASAILAALATAPVFKKQGEVVARPAVAGENITTTLASGTKETDNAANAGDWIVANPSGDLTDGGDRLDVIERQIERMSDSVTKGVGALAARFDELNERVDRHVNRVLELDAIQRKHTRRIAKLAGRVGALDGQTEDPTDL